MSPALERGAHVIQDVRLVVHDQDTQPLALGDRGWGGLDERGLRAAGELDREGGAPARFGVEGDAPTVLFHDSLADGESQAGPLPLAFGGEARLEDVRSDRLWHPRPRCRGAHVDAVAMLLRGDPEPAA